MAEVIVPFRRRIAVVGDPDTVFAQLRSPERLIQCVPGGQLTQVVNPRAFKGHLTVNVGPFALPYSGVGRITLSGPGRRQSRIALEGNGPAGAGNAPRPTRCMCFQVSGSATHLVLGHRRGQGGSISPQSGPLWMARVCGTMATASSTGFLAGEFAGWEWQVPDILAHVARADDLYFDAVIRVWVRRWWSGRIVLLGDAASSVTIFGDGSSMAIVGAWQLATALERHAEVGAAFVAYERAPAETRRAAPVQGPAGRALPQLWAARCGSWVTWIRARRPSFARLDSIRRSRLGSNSDTPGPAMVVAGLVLGVAALRVQRGQSRV